MSSHTTAHHFLEGLAEAGIEHLFCNLGTGQAAVLVAKIKQFPD